MMAAPDPLRGGAFKRIVLSMGDQDNLEKQLAETERKARNTAEADRTLSEYTTIGKELFESGETFPFPGIDPAAYAALKAEEELLATYTTEYNLPGGTPIDELIEKLKAHGIKVAFFTPVAGGLSFSILPADSPALGVDFDNDGLNPRNLMIVDGMDERLKSLILAHRKSSAAEKQRFS